jgi:hypothetical protein
MSLNGTQRYIYKHRPYITNTEEYPHQKWRSHDKTKEKDTGQMKDNPESSIHPYDIKKIL